MRQVTLPAKPSQLMVAESSINQGDIMSTFNKVKEVIIDKLGVEEDMIKTEAHFVNDLGADSLDTVELIMEFEEEFGIEIPDEDAENITTVGSAVDYIDKVLD